MAIHVPQVCHPCFLIETRRRFPVELLAFLPFLSGFSTGVASLLRGNRGRAHPCSSAQFCSPNATHSQKSESKEGLAHPYLSAQPSTPFGTKCHPGGGPAPGRTGATKIRSGVRGFNGWVANQKKDAATIAPLINAPMAKLQIILIRCHASLSLMSHLVRFSGSGAALLRRAGPGGSSPIRGSWLATLFNQAGFIAIW